MAINLLDPSLGIQSVMEQVAPSTLPHARPMASNALREAGLEELYSPANAASAIESALCPDVGDGDVLRPEIFSGILSTCAEEFAGSDDPAVQDLLTNDLRPLLENKELLQAYTGLMIGG